MLPRIFCCFLWVSDGQKFTGLNLSIIGSATPKYSCLHSNLTNGSLARLAKIKLALAGKLEPTPFIDVYFKFDLNEPGFSFEIFILLSPKIQKRKREQKLHRGNECRNWERQWIWSKETWRERALMETQRWNSYNQSLAASKTDQTKSPRFLLCSTEPFWLRPVAAAVIDFRK